MLYLAENTDLPGKDWLEQSLPYLSAQRCDKLRALGAPQDRLNCCAAFLLLRYALFQEYHITEAPEFILGEHEKPFLKEYPSIHFNLSHCRNALCCMVSDRNTAVDITDYRKIRLQAVARRVCSPQEQQALQSSHSAEQDFLCLWTRKECYSKLTGIGLSMDFREITDVLPAMQHIHTLRRPQNILSYYSVRQEPLCLLTMDEILHFCQKELKSANFA